MGAQTEIDRDLYFSSSVVHVWLNTTAMVGQALQHTRPTCRDYKAPDRHIGGTWFYKAMTQKPTQHSRILRKFTNKLESRQGVNVSILL
jgi:hypothetical protein